MNSSSYLRPSSPSHNPSHDSFISLYAHNDTAAASSSNVNATASTTTAHRTGSPVNESGSGDWRELRRRSGAYGGNPRGEGSDMGLGLGGGSGDFSQTVPLAYPGVAAGNERGRGRRDDQWQWRESGDPSTSYHDSPTSSTSSLPLSDSAKETLRSPYLQKRGGKQAFHAIPNTSYSNPQLITASSSSHPPGDPSSSLEATLAPPRPSTSSSKPNRPRVSISTSVAPASAQDAVSPIGRAAHALRRLSLRVVNANADSFSRRSRQFISPITPHPGQGRERATRYHERIRDSREGGFGDDEEDEEEKEEKTMPMHEREERILLDRDAGYSYPGFDGIEKLRGYSLGLFGPDNWLRLRLARLLRAAWTEPLILLLIIANVVVLTLQASKNALTEKQFRKPGYFHAWEDYALFGLFVAFTIEMFARIIVSGLIFGPNEQAELLQRGGSITRSIRPTGRMSLSDMGKRLTRPIEELMNSSFSHGIGGSKTGVGGGRRKEEMLEMEATHEKWGSAMSYNSTTSLVSKSTSTNGSAKRYGNASATSVPMGISSSLNGQKSNSTLKGAPFKLAIERQVESAQTPYLRHSWNRVDFVAILAFWTVFALAIADVEYDKHIYFLRALSVLRAARLLTITSGTSTILQSLKVAGPQLVNVAFFVFFAVILFSIIGVQSFKGSLKRNCVWIDPENQANLTLENQFCGGHIDPETGLEVGYLPKGENVPVEGGKGFICPLGQLCIEATNPNNGTQSFDHIFAASLQVIVISSANTWTTLMFSMMDADFFASSLFFIICVIILNFWLVQLFIAVITNTFATITEETKQSAFASHQVGPFLSELDGEGWNLTDGRRKKMPSRFRTIYEKTAFVWIILILGDIAFQGSKEAGMSQNALDLLDKVELVFTIIFAAEILLRFFSYLPDWRSFFYRAANIADTAIAIITLIIQIPVIKNSEAYPWLTVFQILRFYRVILAVPRMKPLLMRLFGNVSGLINMILFLLLINFIGALIAVQFLRGDIPEDSGEMNFKHIYNGFLAMYQIFSSENWTTVLYSGTSSESEWNQAFIVAIFLAGWLIFAYFILLAMFIAVINESFSVAEEQKREAQRKAFVEGQQPSQLEKNWFTRFNPYRYFKPKPKAVAVENIPSSLVLPMKKNVVRDYMTGQETLQPTDPALRSAAFVRRARRVLRLDGDVKPEKGEDVKRKSLDDDGDQDDWESQLALLSTQTPREMGDMADLQAERIALQRDFISNHPTYDRSLWIFSQRNRFRRFCQRVARPPQDTPRVFGVLTDPIYSRIFQIVVFIAIVGSLVVAAIATPPYRREFLLDHGELRWTWFNLTEVSLGFIFVVEFLIKIIADGFIFAPHAYLLSTWNRIDFFILLATVANIGTAISSGGGVNAFTRALKALRALRLITITTRTRDTFYAVFIIGASRILDASILAILYIIPFAIWGQNLFSGLFYYCNDGNASGKQTCLGEFSSSPLGDWEFLAPRSWINPYVYSFDSFKSALLILFEIISLEGWINVMTSAMGIVGKDQQSEQDASQHNSIFFVIYNLIGAVVILTLFISIIIENFTQRSGMALLTTEQRQWIDLRKLIYRQRPSRRPRQPPTNGFKRWCYDRTIQKNGWWSRTLTGLYIVHIVVLMTQTDTSPEWADRLRGTRLVSILESCCPHDKLDFVFLFLTIIYAIDIFVRLNGLGWTSYRKNGWNLYDILVVTGSFATTFPVILRTADQAAIQLQKLFLVSIAFKLVQKNNSLNQLFKTAVASLPAILNLFAIWLTLFLTWAIFYIEVFGLTRWGPTALWNANYQTFWKALIMLSLASTGEGWNTFMHDYVADYPSCTPSPNFLFSDCGNAAGAYILFISWNVLSMYIFLNMFTGVVVENFSYVFQLYGRVTSINRDEMRRFKKLWNEFDPEMTGYIKRRNFVPFFAKLSGVWEVKPFPDEFRLRALHEVSQPDMGQYRKTTIVDGIDIRKLQNHLNNMDIAEIKRRKQIYNRLYKEAMMIGDKGRGISFNRMLILLAHYKLIDDDNALRLEDLIKRRDEKERVEDLVSIDRVRGLLKTIYWRRRFLAMREEKRLQQAIKDGKEVPAIFVETDHPMRPSLQLDMSALSLSHPLPPVAVAASHPWRQHLTRHYPLHLAGSLCHREMTMITSTDAVQRSASALMTFASRCNHRKPQTIF
ncbi:hypothetical protein BT69DRAFT_1246450 [Atractiella rhizophila]|nr:hypothetical protein BT69DRAFT_1246450 [Atractiella rhizophila]